MSDRQTSNSLANLYVNYMALAPLTDQLFLNKNIDIFKSLRQFPAFGALTLNYKSDAVMQHSGSSQATKRPGGGTTSIFSKLASNLLLII